MDTLSSFYVRLARLELARREAPDPKSGVATNYTTAAYRTCSTGLAGTNIHESFGLCSRNFCKKRAFFSFMHYIIGFQATICDRFRCRMDQSHKREISRGPIINIDCFLPSYFNLIWKLSLNERLPSTSLIIDAYS